MKHPARMVLESRHLTYIALIVGISVLVAKLVDFSLAALHRPILAMPMN